MLSLDCSAAALLIRLDAASLNTLLGLAASVLHYTQYKEYRRLRPQVGIIYSPYAQTPTPADSI